MLAGFELQVDIVQQTDAAVREERKTLDVQSGRKIECLPAGGGQGIIRLDVEKLHGAVIGYAAVLVDLIEFDQLFPRVVEFLLSRQKSHQRPQLQLPFNGQVAAENEYQKGSEASEEIVRGFDRKPVQAPDDADFAQLFHEPAELGHFDAVGAVAVDFVDTVDGLGDPAGEGARQVDPLLVGGVGALLQERQHDHGRGIDAEGYHG